MASRSGLPEMFARFYRQYFGGRLPRYRVVRRALRASDGHCNSRRRVIVLSSRLTGDDLVHTLLHEMCHIGCPGHGPMFRAKLRRIARHAPPSIAAWASREAAQLAEPYPVRQQVWDNLDALAMERPGLPWATAWRLVEYELPPERSCPGSRPRGLRRWARRQWAHLSENYRLAKEAAAPYQKDPTHRRKP